MKAAASIVVVTGLIVAASACIDDTPPAGLILCASDADCPDDLVCLTARHTCAAADVEEVPPSLLDVRFDPPVTKGGVVELIVVADTALSTTTPAQVRFSPGLPAPEVAFARTDDTEQRFIIDADVLAEGGYVVEGVTVTDEDGDEASVDGLNVGFVVDRTAPELFNVTVSGGPADGLFADLEGRRSFTVRALANEALTGSIFIDVAGAAPAAAQCNTAVTSFSCVVTLDGATPTSPTTPVFAEVRDRADNSVRLQLANINVDTTPPTVANVSVDVDGAALPGPGATVTLSVIADEALGDAPALVLVRGDVTVDARLVSVVGDHAVFVVDGDDVPLGTYVARLTFSDVVGHVASDQLLTLPVPFNTGLDFELPTACAQTPGSSGCVDVDGDGHAGRVGCVEGDDDDDTSILVFPGARELPGDGIDNDQVAGDGVADENAGVFCDVEAPAGGDGSPDAPLNDFDDCVDAVLAAESGAVLFLAKRDAPYVSSARTFIDGISIVGGMTPAATSWTRRAGDRSTVGPEVLYGSAERLLVGIEARVVNVRATEMVIADSAIADLIAEIADLRIERVQANRVAMTNSAARVALSDFGSYGNFDSAPSTTMLRSVVRGEVRLDGPCLFVNVAILAGALTNEPAVQHGAGNLTFVHSTIIGGAGPAITAGNTLVAVGNLMVHTGDGPMINGGPSSFALQQNLFVGVDEAALVADFNGVCDGSCVAFDDNAFADAAGFATLFHLDDDSAARDGDVVVDEALAQSASADFDFDCRYADGSADYGADER